MVFMNTKINVGDVITYRDDWSPKPDGFKGPYYREGVVVGVYPHHVVLKTPAGYKISVSNVDLYIENGWR